MINNQDGLLTSIISCAEAEITRNSGRVIRTIRRSNSSNFEILFSHRLFPLYSTYFLATYGPIFLFYFLSSSINNHYEPKEKNVTNRVYIFICTRGLFLVPRLFSCCYWSSKRFCRIMEKELRGCEPAGTIWGRV